MKKRSETKRLLAFLLATALIFANAGVTLAAETASFAQAVEKETAQSMKFDGTVPDVGVPTSYTEVYERIMALQELIPTGVTWNDDSPYGSPMLST